MNLNQKSEEAFVELLIERFHIENEKKDRSGIYGLTQRMMTYNSNKIEGSTLTEDQTASLFDTGVITPTNEIIRTKDIEEANGHFAMFNHMLKTLEQPLSEKLIKEFHYMLKYGVFEDLLNGYPVGEYKNRRNLVSNIKTTLPENVENEMQKLLKEYDINKKHSLEEIALFHVKYETIHPFQDGNGRTGRMIVFRECLKNKLIPLIVKDENKSQYYDALKNYQVMGNFDKLEKYFKSEQVSYFELSENLVLPYSKKCIDARIEEQIGIKERKEAATAKLKAQPIQKPKPNKDIKR